MDFDLYVIDLDWGMLVLLFIVVNFILEALLLCLVCAFVLFALFRFVFNWFYGLCFMYAVELLVVCVIACLVVGYYLYLVDLGLLGLLVDFCVV